VKLAVDLLPWNDINTIYFDLDGTLRYNRPSFIEALTSYILQLGLPSEIANSRSAHRWLYSYWAQSQDLISDRATFDEDEDSFWINHSRRYLLASGCQSEQAARLAPELTHSMREKYTPQDLVADDIPELLQSLKQNGFRLAVISNRNNPFEEQLETLGINSYFEYSLAAGTIDAWKPDPRIFQYALNQMEAKPENAVYVGDNYFADVVGAHNAGMHAVLVDPDRLFPEATCMVIDKLPELETILTKE
jgi:HAD superfamily hydrolase (TIGR01662 family)